jgi:hypothetical protein
MATFVLLHGSGQNARCWARVGALLKKRGHAVVAPDLPKRAPDWGAMIPAFAAGIGTLVMLIVIAGLGFGGPAALSHWVWTSVLRAGGWIPLRGLARRPGGRLTNASLVRAPQVP